MSAPVPKATENERGQVTSFVVILVLVLLLGTGLVLDGGRLLADRRELRDAASSAARAGAQAVSIESLRAGAPTAVSPAAGVSGAEAHLRTIGHGGSGVVTVNGATVDVVVTGQTQLGILGLFGLGTRTVVGRGSARLVRGVSAEES
ncbi:MAG: hypothetical protein AVDCRST_MAG50-3048 [uncultured Acidimicrobiales bacterium]|uniref:Putative Flp pilus-assembly TadG-like N-terminal domain-containing protein n=1 Tax=uncultured Acidimicrobiales bacterium TaxID=310071 RepID=A0A6J4IWX6_9ACTN|nr:MAG: hypothetical protein AVDCRST_MAG50-3048 [uncultured Acidimicrobiales bacterium]